MNRLHLWLQRHRVVVDLMIAAPIILLTLMSATGIARHPVAVVFDGLLILAVVIRRVWFTAAYLLVITVGLATVASGQLGMLVPAHLAMPILLYTAAAIGPAWARRLGVFWIPVAPILAVLAMDTYGSMRRAGNPWPLTELVVFTGLLAAPLVAAWVWGNSVRIRRRFYAQLADRADRLERERDALDRVAVAEERARIARELHDVVAHHVSVMVVQADGAGYALAGDPDRAREALGTISRTGREALTEMRRLLGVLRTADGEAADRAPQPGLDSIAELVGQLRGTGLAVEHTVAGRPRPVGAGTALTAYRVVQESLTNTLKHGGPGVRATVRLAWARDHLRVEVLDDGSRPDGAAPGPDRDGHRQRSGTDDGPPTGAWPHPRRGDTGTAGPAETGAGGHGIIGMRERVLAAGGRLMVGARPEGGFQVAATLPLDRDGGHTDGTRPRRRPD
ncbi:sensor histidine kinase [Polymorphospora sp. NPDC050346]|uniref:sensor histidine kinase n=1 Tax=Polymorphospora sp. NPDC050346 TaxID=3155780 RepID=UPI0033D3AA17